MDGGVTLGRGHVFPFENYKKGARVWHRCPELVWIPGELSHDVTFNTTTVAIRLENGKTVELPVKSADQLPFLRNPQILVGIDDLTALSYLHEPAVLHNLQFRFVEREAVYTYCGIVLVAINPYANCAHLYGEEVIQVYRGVGKQVRELDPHIYAVAEEAFFDMSEYGKNQSIIVSGESGAGKTVSAKFVMKYFASVAGSRKGAAGVEEKVLASNPIMEAIGNAKTIRNDNSSRFGKYIQMNFDERFVISGAEMKTYLLEKSRLVFQAYRERNYHIFYQMCAARKHPLMQLFGLDDASSYAYTNQGGDTEIEGVDDAADFIQTIQALELLGFSAELQRDFLQVLAGILLLGNMQFVDGEDTASIQPSRDAEVRKLCESMYAIDEGELRQWLTNREIRAAGEVVRKPMDRTEATRSRDALTKMLYAQVFSWTVDKVNSALAGGGKTRKAAKFVGVLDIYGFETFEVNSFEQFCINYANEKLQQQFNQHVFKLEQEEYEREEIAWVRIDFYDNQPCIELIEGRPGLIDYLDEQCKVVRGSDAGWLEQVSNCAQLKKKPQLQLPKIRSASFMIKHFAADVSYSVDGFLEKNKDSVSEQLLEVVAGTKFPFLRQLVSSSRSESAGAAAGTGKKTVKKTVAGQFRDSLRELMTVLEATRPHYVRCIKPNDEKERFCFEPRRAIQQLRACGVLETVRISAAGYPSRWAYDDFGRRYRVLYAEGGAMWREKPKQFAEKACVKCLEEDKFALGKTKIFFRTGQVALLERLRQETLSRSAVRIQTAWRGFLARRRYQHIMHSIRVMQASLRAFHAFRRVKYLQMERAATAIQAAWRGYRERKRFSQLRSTVLAIQSHFRANRVRQWLAKMRYEKSAITIQRYFRGYMVRREKVKMIRKVIKVQCFVRRWLAKRRLKELKIEARSVGHLQKLNNGLENKIIQLQQRLDTANCEVSRLSGASAECEMLRTEIAQLEAERPSLLAAQRRMEELELEVERLETEVDVSEAQKGELETRIGRMDSQMQQLQAESAKKIADLSEELEAMSARAKQAEQQVEEKEKECRAEAVRRGVAESEMGVMREQLLQNVSLLASPAFSRNGSMRQGSPPCLSGPDGASVRVGGGGGGGDLDEVALILRQQSLINEMRMRAEQSQRENERLKELMDANALMESLDRRTSLRQFEAQRVVELETAYARLKQELDRLIEEKIEAGLEGMNVQMLVDRVIEENDRRREESTELRAMLTARFERQSTQTWRASPAPDSGHCSSHSDDGSADLDEELCLERQCRQLKQHIETLTRTVAERNIEIEKLQKRLLEAVPPLRHSEGSVEDALRGVHGQINHLTHENISLNEKLLRQAEELNEARGQLRGYSGGLGYSLDNTSDSEIIRLEHLAKDSVEHSALLEVFNVPEFNRILVCDLKPRLARLLTKCFPAYLLLTAFRYHDHAKDETGLTGLFTTVHVILKDTVSRSHDMDVLSLWLVNTWRLFNLLRQYSGEQGNLEWFAGNTDRQNAHRMQAFDLEPIRNQLKARVEECYQHLMKRAIEPVLAPKIVPGILQHESNSELMAMLSGRASNGKEQLSRQPSREQEKPLDALLDLLGFIHAKLTVYGADNVLIGQVFGQMAHWICALSLNHLMFRKELCNFEKAIQIKHNVTEIQSWLADKGLAAHRDALEPLVQASHLLQSRKDESNIDTLCGEMTSKLKPRQIIEILRHYTPSDGFEELGVDNEFLSLVQARLTDREKEQDGEKNQLIMMGTYLPPFDSRPFVYSEFPLETLSLPSCLRLQQVSRLL